MNTSAHTHEHTHTPGNALPTGVSGPFDALHLPSPPSAPVMPKYNSKAGVLKLILVVYDRHDLQKK